MMSSHPPGLGKIALHGSEKRTGGRQGNASGKSAFRLPRRRLKRSARRRIWFRTSRRASQGARNRVPVPDWLACTAEGRVGVNQGMAVDPYRSRLPDPVGVVQGLRSRSRVRRCAVETKIAVVGQAYQRCSSPSATRTRFTTGPKPPHEQGLCSLRRRVYHQRWRDIVPSRGSPGPALPRLSSAFCWRERLFGK